MRQSLAVTASVLLLMSVTAGLRADVVPQNASDLVTLVGRFIMTPPGCATLGNAFAIDRRTFADGSVSSTPFVIPANHKLILTGIDYIVNSPGALAGGPDSVFLSITQPPSANGIVFTNIVPVGVSGNSVQLSGIAMAPGTTPCFSKSGPWLVGEATLHGFLVRDAN